MQTVLQFKLNSVRRILWETLQQSKIAYFLLHQKRDLDEEQAYLNLLFGL